MLVTRYNGRIPCIEYRKFKCSVKRQFLNKYTQIYGLPIRYETTMSISEFTCIADKTLESLYEYLEEIIEKSELNDADITLNNGVLNINFGYPYGTYVINKQTPNRQLWLSSPTSGPKRYDYSPEQNSWIYHRDQLSIHQLLQLELQPLTKIPIDLSECNYSGK